MAFVQMSGDRNWLASKLSSGAAQDRLKLHPHGTVSALLIPFLTPGTCRQSRLTCLSLASHTPACAQKASTCNLCCSELTLPISVPRKQHRASGMEMLPQMATFGMQDIHAMSGWGLSATVETPSSGGTAAAQAPAPAVSGLAVLTEKLLGPAKVLSETLPDAIREVGACPATFQSHA
jgi:hypothetical protein